MDWTSLLVGLFGLLTVIVSARLTYVNQQNIKLREGLNKKKQQTYIALLGFLSKLEDDDTEEMDNVHTQLKKYYNQLLYYASPPVLKAFGDYMQFFYNEFESDRQSDDETNLYQFKLYGDLVVLIRKDLGHVKWFESESWVDIIRLKITDIDQFIPVSSRGLRASHTSPAMLINGKIRK